MSLHMHEIVIEPYTWHAERERAKNDNEKYGTKTKKPNKSIDQVDKKREEKRKKK